MQHKMAIYFADKLFEGIEEEKEKILVAYGIEVFLNEFLKIIFYMSIGIILGKSLEVFFSIAFFLGVRRIAGGRHCRTNVACFIISLLTICGSVIIAYFINEYFRPRNELIFIITIVESIAIIIFIPFKINITNYKQIIMRKVIMLCLLLGGVTIPMAINYYIYVDIVIFLIAIEIVSCISCKRNTWYRY